MKRNFVETLMGALVIIVAGSFLWISYKSGNISAQVDGYVVTARFKQIGSVGLGTDVRIGGIKVGTVIKQYLDVNSYKAVIDLVINNDIKLPADSTIAIVSDGLLGGKYISISPGGDEKLLQNGDNIKYTQDSVNIEDLIGRFAFGGVSGGDKSDANKSDNNKLEDNKEENQNPALPDKL